MCGRKGDRGVGMRKVREYGPIVFNSFACVAYSKDPYEIFNFCDSWGNLNNPVYTDKGGEVVWSENGTVRFLYKNLGDYLGVPTTFYRFHSKFVYILNFKENVDSELSSDGLKPT
jgi:hypothetical protein